MWVDVRLPYITDIGVCDLLRLRRERKKKEDNVELGKRREGKE